MALTKLQGSLQTPSQRYQAMAARQKNGATVSVIDRAFKTTVFTVRKALQRVGDIIAAKQIGAWLLKFGRSGADRKVTEAGVDLAPGSRHRARM